MARYRNYKNIVIASVVHDKHRPLLGPVLRGKDE